MHVRLAATPAARLHGLLGAPSVAAAGPLLLAPASSIHTCGMREPIDVAFLDDELRILRVVRGLRPWRVVAVRGARAALELPAGAAARMQAGQRLALVSPGR
jgi:uncharacterized protein